MISDLKISVNLRWLLDRRCVFILRWSCLILNEEVQKRAKEFKSVHHLIFTVEWSAAKWWGHPFITNRTPFLSSALSMLCSLRINWDMKILCNKLKLPKTWRTCQGSWVSWKLYCDFEMMSWGRCLMIFISGPSWCIEAIYDSQEFFPWTVHLKQWPLST